MLKLTGAKFERVRAEGQDVRLRPEVRQPRTSRPSTWHAAKLDADRVVDAVRDVHAVITSTWRVASRSRRAVTVEPTARMDRVELIIFGLVTGAVYAIAAQWSRGHVLDVGHLQLRPRCARHVLRVRLLGPAVQRRATFWFIPPTACKANGPRRSHSPSCCSSSRRSSGAFIYRVIIRGLEGTSEIVKLVVPISVMLGAIAARRLGLEDRPAAHRCARSSAPESHGRPVFGQSVSTTSSRSWSIAIALAVGLRVLLYRTRTGVAMRAVVDDRPLLELNGGRPDRASLISWMLGVSLSALAGILITPFQGGSLSATLLTLLVINAFAAAMVGRLRSLPLTFVGAVVLGFATRAAFERPSGFMPKRGTRGWTISACRVPMILLFVVLLLLPQDRLRGARGHPHARAVHHAVDAAVDHRRRPCSSSPSPCCRAIMQPTALITLSTASRAGIIVLSLVLLVGYAGEVSFATMAFAGIGGMVFYHSAPDHRPMPRRDHGSTWSRWSCTAFVGAVVALPGAAAARSVPRPGHRGVLGRRREDGLR